MPSEDYRPRIDHGFDLRGLGDDDHPQYLNVARLESGSGFGAWTSYFPTWTSTGTAPALGNATVAAKYARIGRTIIYQGRITFGTTSTYGTGNYRLSLPVTAKAITDVFVIGELSAQDTGTAYYWFPAYLVSTTTIGGLINGTATVWDSARPHTWASTDIFGWSVIYEAAE